MAQIIPKEVKEPVVSTEVPVEDANSGAITSANIDPEPTPEVAKLRRKALAEGAFIHDKTIVAKPLGIPGFQNIKLLNPNIRLRWVNFKAGGGRMFEQMKLCGFQLAKQTDCIIADLPFVDGAWKNGDLIMMKIARSEYDAAMKYNAELALRRVGRDTQLQQGRKNMQDVLKDTAAPPSLKQKISVFNPSDKDMEHTPLAAEDSNV